MTSIVLRGLGFVGLHTALVAAYVAGLCVVLPPFQGEPWGALFVAPAAIVAVLALAPLFVVVRRLETHAGRLLALVVATASGIVAYAAWLAVSLAPPAPLPFVVLVAALTALYGAPLFLAVGVSAKLTSSIFVQRPPRALA